MKTYNELIRINDFIGRYNYLKLYSRVGDETFGSNRYLNQMFYKSTEWLSVRDYIIVRDNGCDLGMLDFEIMGQLYVHHINPITIDDIKNRDPKLLDPNNLILCSYKTHQAIHFGDETLLPKDHVERYPGDTKLW